MDAAICNLALGQVKMLEVLDSLRQPDDKLDALVHECKLTVARSLAPLVKAQSFDPSTEDCYVFRWSCKNGLTDFVDVCLKEQKVDPSAQESEALRLSAHNNRFEVVERLLKDGRANPAARNCEALCRAAYGGHLDIVKALVADSRVNLEECGTAALKSACQKNTSENITVANFLLDQPKVDPGAEESICFIAACTNGMDSIVERLLSEDYNDRVNLTVHNNRGFRYACQNGHRSTVNILLKDDRINPADYNNGAFVWACSNGHTKIVEDLLNDSRIDASIPNNDGLRWANQKQHTEIVRMIAEKAKDNPKITLATVL
jgi:hypothetical protein